MNLVEAPRPHFHEHKRRRFADVLTTYVSPLLPSSQTNLRVISVGCGRATEAGGVLMAFPNASYKGFDIDHRMIDAARTRFNADLSGRIELDVANGRVPESYGTDPWDLAIIQHPDIGSRTRFYLASRQIIQQGIQHIKTGGIVFVSTYYHDEQDVVVDLLRESGSIDIIQAERNIIPEKRVINDIDDKYVTVGKKL